MPAPRPSWVLAVLVGLLLVVGAMVQAADERAGFAAALVLAAGAHFGAVAWAWSQRRRARTFAPDSADAARANTRSGLTLALLNLVWLSFLFGALSLDAGRGFGPLTERHWAGRPQTFEAYRSGTRDRLSLRIAAPGAEDAFTYDCGGASKSSPRNPGCRPDSALQRLQAGLQPSEVDLVARDHTIVGLSIDGRPILDREDEEAFLHRMFLWMRIGVGVLGIASAVTALLHYRALLRLSPRPA